MDELTKSKIDSRAAALTAILWVITVGLGALSFFAGRRIFLDTYNRFFPGDLATSSQNAYNLMNILITFSLSFVVIAVVIGGFEYHFRKAGTPESKWMFARTLAVEAGILLLAAYL